jgi:hypothetical protein
MATENLVRYTIHCDLCEADHGNVEGDSAMQQLASAA